jgi:hypothetical protein
MTQQHTNAQRFTPLLLGAWEKDQTTSIVSAWCMWWEIMDDWYGDNMSNQGLYTNLMRNMQHVQHAKYQHSH